MKSPQPTYVNRPSEPCHLQPFACNDTQLYGFYVKGDRETIQKELIDPALNAPTDGATNYQALTDFVLVSYAIAAKGTSTLPPFSDMGTVPENSWTVWIPLIVVKNELGMHVAQRLVFYPAYICVDDSWSFAAGREIYGFPKNYGPVEIPTADQPPAKFSASTLVLKEYAPENEGVIAPVMEIERTAEACPGDEVWKDAKDAIKALVGFVKSHGDPIIPGFNLLVDLYELAKHESVPGVFLKQFRDAEDGTKACYQAIIEANSSVTKLNGGGLLNGTFNVVASEFASHPIASTLGLDPSGVEAEFPFWTNMNFTIGNGKEIWKAG